MEWRARGASTNIWPEVDIVKSVMHGGEETFDDFCDLIGQLADKDSDLEVFSLGAPEKHGDIASGNYLFHVHKDGSGAFIEIPLRFINGDVLIYDMESEEYALYRSDGKVFYCNVKPELPRPNHVRRFDTNHLVWQAVEPLRERAYEGLRVKIKELGSVDRLTIMHEFGTQRDDHMRQLVEIGKTVTHVSSGQSASAKKAS